MPAGPLAIVVADLGYGDGGKGGIADFICHDLGMTTIYRHCGGPNSVHHVAAGKIDTAVSAFGSHLSPATRVHLGRDFALKPRNVLLEARQIERAAGYCPLAGLSVDPLARVVLPYHAVVGQIREIVATVRRGSTGQGVGEAVADARRDRALALTVVDCQDIRLLARKLRRIFEAKLADAEALCAAAAVPAAAKLLRHLERSRLDAEHVSALSAIFGSIIKVCDTERYLAQAMARGLPILCEGAHGALIDKDYGFPPFVTRSSTTAEPVLSLLRSLPVQGRVLTVGVVRAVAFRHGPGPFVAEDPAASIDEVHNSENPWQGKPRHGWFDVVASRYAFECNRRPDVLAVTMLDALARFREPRIVPCYEIPGDLPEDAGQFLDIDRRSRGVTRVSAIRRDFPQSPRLTQLLGACRPVLASLGRREAPATWPLDDLRVRSFLARLASEEILGAPVGVLSCGPRREDKRITSAFAALAAGHGQ